MSKNTKVENQVENGSDIVKSSRFSNFVFFIAPAISIAVLLVLWFIGSRGNERIFPSPITVFFKLCNIFVKPLSGSTLLGHIGISMMRVFAGLGAAIIVGVPLGTLIGWNKTVKASVGALFECIRPIPVLAWIPLIIMWFGIGEQAKIIMIFIGALMPIVVNSYTGIKLVSSLYLDVGRMFNCTSQSQLLTKIVLPAALPTIFAGIRNATSVAWMVVLASEMLAAKAGLGFLINRGMEVFDISLCLAGMVSIGICGAMLGLLTNLIERMICPWSAKKKSD